MIKTKSKIAISLLVVLAIVTMQLTVFAANEKIEMVKKDTNEYLIYVKDTLESEFKFAFSNNVNETKNNLAFINSALDSIGEDANNIAYINDVMLPMFEDKAYLWVKNSSDNYILEGVEVDITKAITETELDTVSNITKVIPVDVSKTNTTEITQGDKKIITTVGKAVIVNQGNYEYILSKADSTETLNNLTNLASKISKFNTNTDMYTKVLTYREFLGQLKNVSDSYTNDTWQAVTGNEIEQPETAKDKEKYVLLLRDVDTNEQDVQFLTSIREESIEKIVEKVTTKLPVTYDDNTLLIVLAVLVTLAVLTSVRIRVLNKKQDK